MGCYPVRWELGGRSVGRGGKFELRVRRIRRGGSLRGVGDVWVEAEGFA